MCLVMSFLQYHSVQKPITVFIMDGISTRLLDYQLIIYLTTAKVTWCSSSQELVFILLSQGLASSLLCRVSKFVRSRSLIFSLHLTIIRNHRFWIPLMRLGPSCDFRVFIVPSAQPAVIPLLIIAARVSERGRGESYCQLQET